MNSNSVAQQFQAEFEVVQKKLAIFFHNIRRLPVQVDLDGREFFVFLERQCGVMKTNFEQRPDLLTIAYPDGLGYMSSLHLILYELKSFLDLFSRLIWRLVSTNPGPNGFRSGVVGGKKLSGGKFITWLDRQDAKSLPNRNQLVQLFTAASSEWITDAVNLRDTIAHFREIRGFQHMRIPVTNGPKQCKLTDIQPPEMPGSQSLETFVLRLRNQLGLLISEVLKLTPGVNSQINEPWVTASLRLGSN